MYHELSPEEYQRLRDTAQELALQLRHEAMRDAPEALRRHLATASRSAWRFAVRLERHQRQRTDGGTPMNTAGSSLCMEG